MNETLVHYTGVISSRVSGTLRNTIGEIETFIRHDIIRSLTTRMQIYYDALLANDDGGNDDEAVQDLEVNSTIPPRRVFFPNKVLFVMFCDYLFQNETKEATVKTSMDILGNTISVANVDDRLEDVAQLHSAQEKSDNFNSSNEEVSSARDTSRMLLILGIVGAVVGLIIGLVIHYLMQ